MDGIESAALAPVTGKARIDVLDVLRGMAILGILYMNIPYMGNSGWATIKDPRAIGWTTADRDTWSFIEVVLEGTQRGMLELLFGAGLMVLATKSMRPDGPVAVADLYLRRNLWLLLFGLAHVLLLFWPGDILHIYAVAALFLFPFRLLTPKLLIPLGLLFATFTAIEGTSTYIERAALIEKVEAVKAKQAARQPLTKGDRATMADWRKKLDSLKPDKEQRENIRKEREGRTGGLLANAEAARSIWWAITVKGSFLFGVIEAFSVMLIGIALFKLGIIQGGRSIGFYGVMMILAYVTGFGLRAVGLSERLTFMPIPKTIWATEEYARIAVTLGHLALVNLAMKLRLGAAFLAPFKAVGRMAFSVYIAETLIMIWLIFAPWGLGLWGRYSYAMLALIATLVLPLLVILSNLWLRRFAMGPLEWAWRSLAYWRLQPFRRRPAEPRPIVV